MLTASHLQHLLSRLHKSVSSLGLCVLSLLSRFVSHALWGQTCMQVLRSNQQTDNDPLLCCS